MRVPLFVSTAVIGRGMNVVICAGRPVGSRPKGRCSRGKLPVLEADILNRGSDTRKPPENRVRVGCIKTDRL